MASNEELSDLDFLRALNQQKFRSAQMVRRYQVGFGEKEEADEAWADLNKLNEEIDLLISKMQERGAGRRGELRIWGNVCQEVFESMTEEEFHAFDARLWALLDKSMAEKDGGPPENIVIDEGNEVLGRFEEIIRNTRARHWAEAKEARRGKIFMSIGFWIGYTCECVARKLRWRTR